MKTLVKIAAGLLLFIIILIVGLNLYFSDERLKKIIMPYVNDAAGREVQVEEMSLTFFSTFPQPGLSIRNMTIPGDTPDDTLASLEEFVAGVELFPLLGNRINITEIILRKPKFQYRVNPDSTSNLDFLMTGEPDTAAVDSTVYELNIPRFTITGARLQYHDATSSTSVLLDDLDANISLQYADLITSSVDAELGGLSATVDGQQYLNRLPLSLSQRSVLDLAAETLNLGSGTFSIRGLNLSLSGAIANWSSDTPSVDLRFASSSDNFSEILHLVPDEFSRDIEQLETRGSLSINGSLNGVIGGDTPPSFNVDLSVQDGYLKYPDLPQSIDRVEISANATRDHVDITSFNLQAGQNRFSLNGDIQHPMDEPRRSVNLSADLFFDLSTIKNFYPIDEDTLKLEGTMTAKAVLKGKADQIERAVESGTITLQNGYIASRHLGKPIEDITLTSTLEGNRLSISEARFRSGKNDLSISGTVTDYLSEDPAVDLQMRGSAQFSEIQNYYDLQPTITELTGSGELNLAVAGPLQDPAGLRLNGRAVVSDVNMSGDSLGQPVKNLNGEMQLTPGSVDLTDLRFQLGSSDLVLSGSLTNYMEYLKLKADRETTPELTGRFRSSYFTLDELIDWEDTTTTPIPIELPDLNSSVSAGIDTLLITGVTMRNLSAEAGTTPSRITLEKASIELFGGNAEGSFVWSVPRPDRTDITFRGTLDGLQIGSFFEEFQVLGEKSLFHRYVTGSFSADVEYYSELDVFLEPDIPSTEMNGSFTMTKSRIKGHPLQERLAMLLKADELRNIALDESNTRFQISNSVMTIENLGLTSGDIGAEMSGTRHLINDSIDYKLSVFLPGRFRSRIASVISEQATEALTQENGTILLPLRVTGTQANPQIRPDQDVIKPILKEFLKDKAGNALKKLFGN
ncbi:MAG: AsmA-like C-terminal region-containing protein [Balneolaceae bacterium]|nr:AsmA-like C-terminal region-containing protein [Balneolaceae bacterium]